MRRRRWTSMHAAMLAALAVAVVFVAPADALWVLPTLLVVAPPLTRRFPGETWLLARLPGASAVAVAILPRTSPSRVEPRSRPLLGGVVARPPPLLRGT